jgi:transposase InsO family protein
MKILSIYLKMRVLGAIDSAPGKSIRDRIKEVSKLEFLDDEGIPRSFTWRTIETWRVRYRKHGITGMGQAVRKDKGLTRKISPEELLEAINQALPYFRGETYNRSQIYKFCIAKGLLDRFRLGQTTFYRYIRTYDLLCEKPQDNKKREAFAMRYANELWQADTMVGPFVPGGGGKPVQAKLIAFIDDASRLICHGEFFLEETTASLMNAFKQAFYKRGIPQALYVDNGAIYSSQEITLVCAGLGCQLRHTPVRDGAAKGKIERFFRTVRESFLIRKLDLSSLATLNRQFRDWVEDEYNNSVHSSIGLKPLERFSLDLSRIRFLEPSPYNDELFYARDTRRVKKDNTFSFRNTRYEAPGELREREIEIRFPRTDFEPVLVYYKNQRFGEARTVNLIANGKLGRSGGQQ